MLGAVSRFSRIKFFSFFCSNGIVLFMRCHQEKIEVRLIYTQVEYTVGIECNVKGTAAHAQCVSVSVIGSKSSSVHFFAATE